MPRPERKRLLLAGASGFLGRHVCLAAPADWEIVAQYHRRRDFPAFVAAAGLGQVTPVACDLTDAGAVASLRDKVGAELDGCLFLHGNSDIARSIAAPADDLRANVTALLNVISAFRIARFVFNSSGTVYLGHRGAVTPETPVEPAVPYGVSKLASELYLRAAQRAGRVGRYVVLRFFGAYGPFEPPRKIFTQLVQALVVEGRREYVIRGDGTNLIDAMYVDDAVAGFLGALGGEAGDVTVDFCRGRPQSIADLVGEAARILGRPDVRIVREGSTTEPIAFHASPAAMASLFGVTASIPLEVGLPRLRDHLLREAGRPVGAGA